MDEKEKKEELRALEKINIRLKKFRHREAKPSKRSSFLRSKSGKVLGYAMRAGVELAAAILIASMFGVVIDKWLGTAPWIMLVMFIIGTAAGFVNFYRALMVVQKGEINANKTQEGR